MAFLRAHGLRRGSSGASGFGAEGKRLAYRRTGSQKAAYAAA